MSTIIEQLHEGQLVLPKEFREALGLEEDDPVAVTLTNGRIVITATGNTTAAEGSPWAKELYEAFSPVRESLQPYSEDDINSAIDQALEEVRREKQ